MIVVSDTSPVCYLTLIGHEDLHQRRFGQVIIPEAVRRELCHPGAPRQVSALASAPPPWLEIHAVVSVADAALTSLHPGEQEAILLAEELGADLVILDEAAARRVAVSRGLRVTGLLGVLAEGATRGIVDLPDAVARLQATNFRASPRLLKALRGFCCPDGAANPAELTRVRMATRRPTCERGRRNGRGRWIYSRGNVRWRHSFLQTPGKDRSCSSSLPSAAPRSASSSRANSGSSIETVATRGG